MCKHKHENNFKLLRKFLSKHSIYNLYYFEIQQHCKTSNVGRRIAMYIFRIDEHLSDLFEFALEIENKIYCVNNNFYLLLLCQSVVEVASNKCEGSL